MMAEGAIRDWRMCASEERRAIWMDCRGLHINNLHRAFHTREMGKWKVFNVKAVTHVQPLKVLANFEHELLRAFFALRETIFTVVRLW
jgi:hypothetical protein